MGWYRYTWLAYFAKPSEDRVVYREVKRRQVGSVLEIGVGSLERSKLLISACQSYSSQPVVRYAAVDWFEERPESMPRLSLIAAHRELNATGAKVRVAPGGPSAVEGMANSLPNTDLVLISPEVDDAALGRGWFFLPRICHAETLVLRGSIGSGGERQYNRLSLEEIRRRSELARPAAAA
ncbi:hypothetical protein [Posidoniimonas polymericola]|nr:hypothetical protein [Posidoniimonas polymericola]